MGLRINLSTLSGFLNLQKTKQEAPFKERNLASEVRGRMSAPANKFSDPLAISGVSGARRDLSPRLSQTLSLSRNGLLPEEAQSLFDQQIRESEPIQARNRDTENLGNRQISESSSAFIRLERRFPDAEDPVGALASADITRDFSQSDFQNLRNAVATIARETVEANPSISDEDLRDTIDTTFGSGTASLLKVRLIEDDVQKSRITLSQFEETELSAQEKGVAGTALNQASAIFKFESPQNELTGPDIDRMVQELGSILPFSAQGLVLDLEKSLKQPGNVDEKLQRFESELDNLSLRRSTRDQTATVLQEIRLRNDVVLEGFDSNAISDDLSLGFSTSEND